MQVAYLDFQGNGNSIQTREKKITNKLPGQQRNDDVKENPTGKMGIEFVGQMDPMIVNKKIQSVLYSIETVGIIVWRQAKRLLAPAVGFEIFSVEIACGVAGLSLLLKS